MGEIEGAEYEDTQLEGFEGSVMGYRQHSLYQIKTHSNVRYIFELVIGNSLKLTNSSIQPEFCMANLLTQIYTGYLALTNFRNSRLHLPFKSKRGIIWVKSKARNEGMFNERAWEVDVNGEIRM